ncbi:MAG: efflux RND transporter permease subunit [Acetobacteraceae bacterium]
MSSLNLSAWALRHRALTVFMMLAIAAAGTWSYFKLGRGEDPPFTIKQMVIQTQWPGASADQMSRLIVDRLERKLQELPMLDRLDATIQPGLAYITVNLRDDTPPAQVPDLWYEVRKKVGDIAPTLPAGVIGPFFNDEFGDVYGIVYAFTGDGFTLPQLRHVVDDVRESLLSVRGVGKITIIGAQEERIYIEFSHRKLAELGLTVPEVINLVARENAVEAGGFAETPRDRIYVRTADGLPGEAALRDLPISAGNRRLKLGDIATVTRGTVDPPLQTMSVNGKPGLGLAISMAPGGNILDLGKAIAAKMEAIAPTLPLGVSMLRVNDQSQVVAKDVVEFQESFVEALAIVLLVSFVSLGWRTGLVVAISVPLVLAGVMIGMKLLGIDLQRISLGAMIIALGLLVDDAIIAVETMVVKLEQGWDKLRAGSFAYTSTAFPMLTGTLVTAAGYLPVGLAQSTTGEYTRDIFRVVGLSLILSWFVAVLFVPLIGAALLKVHPAAAPDVAEHDVYDTRFYNWMRRVVSWCVRARWWVIGGTAAAFVLAAAGFTLVPRQFFPSSDRLEVIVDLRMPEGGSFTATAAEVARVEDILKQQPGIRSWVAYTGVGAPRFFLAFAPVLQVANFGQFVINTADVAARDALVSTLKAAVDHGDFADARVRVSRLELGPPIGYPVQFRVTGPDPAELRRIAAQIGAVMRDTPQIRSVNQSWGNQGKAVTIAVDQEKARLLGLSSRDVAQTVQTLLQGVTVSQYREHLDLIPIVIRAEAPERQALEDLGSVMIRGGHGRSVPLSQIASIRPVLEEDYLERRDRKPALSVRGEIAGNAQAPDVTAHILPHLAAIKAALPPGYSIETGGAAEESGKGQASINAVMPVMVLTILALLMVQMQSFSRVVMVLLTAPLGLIGVSAALLITQAPFGFVAMLGFIALAGIIMRNSVILVDQIQHDLREGASPSQAIVEATVRRTRPIVLTAAAAILALVPLAMSVFWGPMAIAIMGGLVSATVLTLFFVPALYAAWTRAPRPVATLAEQEDADGDEEEDDALAAAHGA